MRILTSTITLLLILGLPTVVARAGDEGDGAQEKAAVPEAVDIGALTAEQRAVCLAHVKETGRTPTAYVVSKFADHDLVIVGETHQIHENCRVISESIEPLATKTDVRLLLTEFVRNSNTKRLNELLKADSWDVAAIHAVMRDWAWPTWGYEEYRDILHAVWKVNQQLPEGSPPFRVVGLDNDWDQYEYGWGGLSRAEKFKNRADREAHLVGVAQREVFDAEEKALVHIGYAHSLTGQGLRFGTVLTKNHGARVFQIVLHPKLPARGGAAPITSLLEAIWTEAGAKPVGFDVLGSPLGALQDTECLAWGYLANGVFQDLAQGYILVAPLADLQKATWIPGFIDEAGFERARKVAIKARMAKPDECETPESLDACLQRLYPKR